MRAPVGIAACRADPSVGHPLPRPTRSLDVVPVAVSRHRVAGSLACPIPTSGHVAKCRGCPKDHHERKVERMKLTTMTQVTVDGVMQGNGAASDEDRRGGFERGGWAMGVFDDDTLALINETYQRADAFLFGRRTYELFAGCWGAEKRARAALKD